MVTYVRRECRCCGEEIDWPLIVTAPRCDECRVRCPKIPNHPLGKPIPCRRGDD